MNRDEARNILLLYRPNTADDRDPQVLAALALAKNDPDLARWLAAHSARQNFLQEKFQEIPVPAGLKEQIVSEQKAAGRRIALRRNALVAALAVVMLAVSALFWFPSRPADDTFTVYRSRMVSSALRGYSMDLATNDSVAVRSYLTQRQAPADYALPEALQRVEVAGCAVQSWQGVKVAMICFRTGKPLPPGQQSDLWLFVIDRTSVKESPAAALAQLASVNRLITAAWTQGDKLYLLGTEGDEKIIRQYL